MVRVFLVSYHLRLLNDFHWRIALHKVYYTHKCTYTRKHTGGTRGGNKRGETRGLRLPYIECGVYWIPAKWRSGSVQGS